MEKIRYLWLLQDYNKHTCLSAYLPACLCTLCPCTHCAWKCVLEWLWREVCRDEVGFFQLKTSQSLCSFPACESGRWETVNHDWVKTPSVMQILCHFFFWLSCYDRRTLSLPWTPCVLEHVFHFPLLFPLYLLLCCMTCLISTPCTISVCVCAEKTRRRQILALWFR